jgi:hypothetical protein
MTETGRSSTIAALRPSADRRGDGRAAPRTVDEYDVVPLGEGYRRHRWVRSVDVEWAERADRILIQHGAVSGTVAYKNQQHARWHGRQLIALWNDLGLRPRSELREDVVQVTGGWVWTIEHLRPDS